MRKILLLIFFIPIALFAQRRDNIWMLAPWGGSGYHPYSGINFNSGIADTITVLRNMGFLITNTSICDTSGNLLFYSNGVVINNANHDTLLGSDNFNPGYASSINANQLNILQGALIIPKPGNDSLYYIFNISGEQFMAYGFLQQQPLDLKYTVINKKLDNGLGAVIPNLKGVNLVIDTLMSGSMNACKHGNGRDWWIVMPRFYSNKYYKLLLSPDTVVNYSSQTIGDSILFDGFSQSCFSPDGSKYAIVTYANDLNIFRFDRCTGLFFDSTFIIVPNPTPGLQDNQAYGLAFSPNSRFLYIILYTRIIQYDTWASNIGASQIYVAQWDTFANPFYTYFLSAQLAPDNKIYIGTYGACQNLHYINEPDSLGIACDVIQNTFALPTDNFTVPTFPNYDLGPSVGSPCDTITGIKEIEQNTYTIKIFPNPASGFIYINYKIPPNETAQFVLYNTMGEVVSKNNLYGSFKSLLVHTNKLIDGVYYYNIVLQNESIANGKIAIIH